MVEEKELKEDGEQLARIAVESGMGLKQLQTIYRLVKTKPMAYVQAYIQRQIGRGVRGFSAFMKLLELSKKYEEDRAVFEKVLMYAIMLYDYIEAEPTMKLSAVSEGIVRNIVNRQGVAFEGLQIKLFGNSAEVRVKTGRFHGNPKALAMEIERALTEKVPEFRNMRCKIWIE
ncbi:MAG: hypothetical protein ACPLKQ_05780 [Candidatus Bathyarchaeales archaeon]